MQILQTRYFVNKFTQRFEFLTAVECCYLVGNNEQHGAISQKMKTFGVTQLTDTGGNSLMNCLMII